MGIFNRLFRRKLSESDRKIIIQSAYRLVQIINESLQIAVKTNNIEIKK